MRVLSPFGKTTEAKSTISSGPRPSAGLRIGFLSNGKLNSAELLGAIERQARTRYNFAGSEWANKKLEAFGPAEPATEAILERLSSRVSVAFVASGD